MIDNVNSRLQELGIDVNGVIDALSLTTQPYTIYLSGSLIEGYGNAESDIDVYVIYPDELPALRYDNDMQTNVISIEYLAERRVDIESWSKSQVLATAQRFRDCASNKWDECIAMAYNELDFAHHIRTGIPLLHEEHFQQLRQAFDFQHVSRIHMTRYLEWYHSAHEDTSGAITSQQYGTALLMARRAIQLAIDVLLASQGETNMGEKWRFFKLEKLGDRSLIEQYWALETQGISSQAAVLDYAKACLTFASQLVLKAQKAVIK